MKYTIILCAVFCVGAASSLLAFGDPASTRPSTTGTPIDAALAWQDLYENSTADGVLSEYAVDNDQDRAVAKSLADASIAATHLVKLAREKWGADGEKAVADACETDTRAEDAAAHVTIDGDHAVMAFDNQQIGKFYIVRRDGAWKIDVAKYEKENGPDIAGFIKSCEQGAQTLNGDIASALAGKYSSCDQLVAEINHQLGNQ